MLFACVSVDWTELVAALVAAVVAVSGTIAAKHRPAGALTRATDREPAAAAADLFDDLEVWDEGHPAEPLTGWPPRRARGRVRRAAAELRRREE